MPMYRRTYNDILCGRRKHKLFLNSIQPIYSSPLQLSLNSMQVRHGYESIQLQSSRIVLETSEKKNKDPKSIFDFCSFICFLFYGRFTMALASRGKNIRDVMQYTSHIILDIQPSQRHYLRLQLLHASDSPPPKGTEKLLAHIA